MTTGTRLAIGGAFVASVTGYMAYLGAASSWEYYLTVDECAEEATSLVGRPIRVSGRVAPGTLRINDVRTNASFLLRGAEQEFAISCSGPLPDNLGEDMDVVVEGRLESASLLKGEKVITRCASKYETKESRTPAHTASAAKPEAAR